MATDEGDSEDDEKVGRRVRRSGWLAATTLLPIVRAAMARGEGPPAVLKWVKRQGQSHTGCLDWTPADEARARVLAHRLAVTLNDRRRADAVTEQLNVTIASEGRTGRQYE